VLSRTELRHGALVIGSAGEVVAADPLDRDDPSRPQRNCGGGKWIAGRDGYSATSKQAQRRSAIRARVRLGVEAPVRRIVVLGTAAPTHREAGHRRPRAVVGDAPNDREPWAAVRAVDERVATTAIAGIEQLRQALLAGGAVGCHGRVCGTAGRARKDRKPGFAGRPTVLGADALDQGEWRRLRPKPREESFDCVGVALDLEQYPSRVVEHEAAQVELTGEPVDVGAEADALHRAIDPCPDPPSQCGRGVCAHPTSSRRAW
jgi:hypothetical protein